MTIPPSDDLIPAWFGAKSTTSLPHLAVVHRQCQGSWAEDAAGICSQMRRVRWLADLWIRGRGKCIVALGDKGLPRLSPLSTFQMDLSAPGRFAGE